jgi:hypothetical protein
MLRWIGLVVLLVVAVGAGYGLASGDPMAAVDAAGNVTIDAVSGPETENLVKTIETGRQNTKIDKIELYESGAANITFHPDHGSNYKLAFAHTDNDICQQHYRTWQPPEFSGPITVDLGSVIASNGPYPNDKFRLEGISEGNGVCLDSISGVTFSAPAEWDVET